MSIGILIWRKDVLRRIGCLCLCGLALYVVPGCVIDGSESGANATVETQTETFIDPDATKENALGLIFGMPQIDDRLDYDAGDREDWRYIIVAEQGVMSVTINVDQPQNIDGGWNIIDSEGRTLHRQSFSKNEGYYEFRDFPVKRGVYYFQTFATSGRSIYTIATSFRPTYQPPAVQDEYHEDVAAEVSEPAKNVKKPSSRKPKPASSGSGAKPKAEKPKAERAAADDKPASTKLVGSITGITPKPDGTAEITIRGIGKNKGVETGAVGKIRGTGIKLEMSVCFATSCRAIVPADANPTSLKTGASVEFSL